MGALPQWNSPLQGWPQFFTERRLRPQLQLAMSRQMVDRALLGRFERLFLRLPEIFGPTTQPVLVHGDLWSGNLLCDDEEQPVLIDPAVYLGHPCVDLAMTTLFGGFEAGFYDRYREIVPLPFNYREQWDIANLYPLLIHLNLFGKGYLPDILHTIDRY
ncbi:fructosamine kinase family protein [Paraflavitalea pollutisoli]|uniref:fructosamine kinase family protein n=1 Tax=Paraflavitalea pollutisoli TaxID=3034143 RepID=UPI0023EBE55A|nr:fructosamine kinase family protein [Paraflavitalea sp. H1-2-19X]